MKIDVLYETGDNLLPEAEENLFCLWAASVYRERVKQLAKWGDQRHADDTGGDSLRQAAEHAQHVCQVAARHIVNDRCVGDPGWRLILNEEVDTAPGGPDIVGVEADEVWIGHRAQLGGPA